MPNSQMINEYPFAVQQIGRNPQKYVVAQNQVNYHNA